MVQEIRRLENAIKATDIPNNISKVVFSRDRLRVVILKLNSKEYIDGVLKSKVNLKFL